MFTCQRKAVCRAVLLTSILSIGVGVLPVNSVASRAQSLEAKPDKWITTYAGLWQAPTVADAIEEGKLLRMPIVYEQTYFGHGKPGGRVHRINNDPTEPAVRWFADVRDNANSQPDDRGMVGMDIEIYLQTPWVGVDKSPTGHPAGGVYNAPGTLFWDPAKPSIVANRYHPDGGWHRANIKRLTQAAYRTVEATGKKVAVYGFPPAADFYGYLNGFPWQPGHHVNGRHLQAANDAYLEEHTIRTLGDAAITRSMLDVVSEFHPTLYVRVLDARTGPAKTRLASWKTSVTNQIIEAKRIIEAYRVAKGLPEPKHKIVPYIWPQYGFQVDSGKPGTTPSSQLYGYKYMDYETWTMVLETLSDAGADGFVLWGGGAPGDYVYVGSPEAPTARNHPPFAQQPFDENAPWWRATLDFLRTKKIIPSP